MWKMTLGIIRSIFILLFLYNITVEYWCEKNDFFIAQKRLPPEMWFPVPDGVATLGQ